MTIFEYDEDKSTSNGRNTQPLQNAPGNYMRNYLENFFSIFYQIFRLAAKSQKKCRILISGISIFQLLILVPIFEKSIPTPVWHFRKIDPNLNPWFWNIDLNLNPKFLKNRPQSQSQSEIFEKSTPTPIWHFWKILIRDFEKIHPNPNPRFLKIDPNPNPRFLKSPSHLNSRFFKNRSQGIPTKMSTLARHF